MVATATQIDPSRSAMIRRVFQKDFRERLEASVIAVKSALTTIPDFTGEDQALSQFNQRSEHIFNLYLSGPWSKRYVRTAFAKAGERAFRKVRRKVNYDEFGNGQAQQFVRGLAAVRVSGEVEIVFNASPLTKFNLLAEQVTSQIKGMKDQLQQSSSRIVATGLAAGLSKKQIANNLNEAYQIGWNRAVLIANTETVRIVAEATLDAFDALGVEQVGLEVELSTADDEKVCPICVGLLENNPYLVKDARGLIPAHPSCRCNWTVPS